MTITQPASDQQAYDKVIEARCHKIAMKGMSKGWDSVSDAECAYLQAHGK